MPALSYLSRTPTGQDMNRLITEFDRRLTLALDGRSPLVPGQGTNLNACWTDMATRTHDVLGYWFRFTEGTLTPYNDVAALYWSQPEYVHSNLQAIATAAVETARDVPNEVIAVDTTADTLKLEGSLEAHTRVDGATTFYLAVDERVRALRKHEYAVAELVCEGLTTFLVPRHWNRFACFRIHNLTNSDLTVTIERLDDELDDEVIVVKRYGCAAFRRAPNGYFDASLTYFWKWQAARNRPVLLEASGSSVATWGIPERSARANPLCRPMGLLDWFRVLDLKLDPLELPDQSHLFPMFKTQATASVFGDLLHHSGEVWSIGFTVDPLADPPAILKGAFNGYATLVTDLAALGIEATLSGGVWTLARAASGAPGEVATGLDVHARGSNLLHRSSDGVRSYRTLPFALQSFAGLHWTESVFTVAESNVMQPARTLTDPLTDPPGYSLAEVAVPRAARTTTPVPRSRSLSASPAPPALAGLTTNTGWRLTPAGWRCGWSYTYQITAAGVLPVGSDGLHGGLYDDISDTGLATHRGCLLVSGQGWPLDGPAPEWLGATTNAGTPATLVPVTPGGLTVNQFQGHYLHNVTLGWIALISTNAASSLTLAQPYTWALGNSLEIWPTLASAPEAGTGNPHGLTPQHSRRYALTENVAITGFTDPAFTSNLSGPGGTDIVPAERPTEVWSGVKVLGPLASTRPNATSMVETHRLFSVVDSPHVPKEVETRPGSDGYSIYAQRASLVAEAGVLDTLNNSALFHVLPVLPHHFNLLAWQVNAWKRVLPLCTLCDVLFEPEDFTDGEFIPGSPGYWLFIGRAHRLSEVITQVNGVGQGVTGPAWCCRNFVDGPESSSGLWVQWVEALGITVKTTTDLPGRAAVAAMIGEAATIRYGELTQVPLGPEHGFFVLVDVYQEGGITGPWRHNYQQLLPFKLTLGALTGSGPAGTVWNFHAAEQTVAVDIINHLDVYYHWWLDARDVEDRAEDLDMVFTFEQVGIPLRLDTFSGNPATTVLGDTVLGTHQAYDDEDVDLIARVEGLLDEFGFPTIPPPVPTPPAIGAAFPADGNDWSGSTAYDGESGHYGYLSVHTSPHFARWVAALTPAETNWISTGHSYGGVLAAAPWQDVNNGSPGDPITGIGGVMTWTQGRIGQAFVLRSNLAALPGGVTVVTLANAEDWGAPYSFPAYGLYVSDGRPAEVLAVDRGAVQNHAVAVTQNDPANRLVRSTRLVALPDHDASFDAGWLVASGGNLALGQRAIPRTLTPTAEVLTAAAVPDEVVLISVGSGLNGAWQVQAHRRTWLDLE